MVYNPLIGLQDTPQNARRMLAGLCMISFSCAIVLEVFYARLMFYLPKEQWVFQGIISLIIYIIPLTVITICYCLMRRRLHGSVRSMSSVSELMSVRNALARRKKLANRMILLVMIFALCWLPYNVIFLIVSIIDPLRTEHYVWLDWLWLVADCIDLMNFILCPVAMAYVNRDLLTQAKDMLFSIRSFISRLFTRINA